MRRRWPPWSASARRRAGSGASITIVVVAAVVVGVYFLLKPGPKAKVKLTAQQIARRNAARWRAAARRAPTTVLHKPSWKTPPAMTIDTAKTYTATVKTDVGTFVITLDAKHAPMTVNNFVFLAQQEVLQLRHLPPGHPGLHGPDRRPHRDRHGRPRLQVRRRAARPDGDRRSTRIGSVAMANSGPPNTNGSQFFIVTGSEGESPGPTTRCSGR